MRIDRFSTNNFYLRISSKAKDLAFFLGLVGIQYQHWRAFAPTKEILAAYRADQDFNAYAARYAELIERRDAVGKLPADVRSSHTVGLRCSEPTADRCHRRLAAELISNAHPQLQVRYL
ncbi:MAG: DUF488 domain-containing protein [Armatimonadia bacterium]